MRSVVENNIKERFLKIYNKENDNLKDVMINNTPIIYGYIISLDSKRDSGKYDDLNNTIFKIKNKLTNLFGEGSVLSYVIDKIYDIFNNEEKAWYDVVVLSTTKSNEINRIIFPFEILHYLNIFISDIDKAIQGKYIEAVYESYEEIWIDFIDDDIVDINNPTHSSIIISLIYTCIEHNIAFNNGKIIQNKGENKKWFMN